MRRRPPGGRGCWPWQLDLIAIALHKTNVYIDISGWAPKRIPPEVIRELRGRLSGQFLWGSDFPFINPERCLGPTGRPRPARGCA
jgi:predicted TIM-barrel fold metal-dependent hydrolase